ncbi:hypothetical protein EYC59_02855 [Candidatus Saccharibacteria bacterium]|nr:MAG: hypothetical protein EYC59_02855 [Candidatus Saccharibacteria bacterium]
MGSLSFFAHAFGQNFSLPLPVGLFVFGGVVAVVLSFVMVSLFAGGTAPSPTTSTYRYHDAPWLAPLALFAKLASLAVWLLAVAAGLFGSPFAGYNLNVTLFWVVLFVGFTYLTAIFGDVWKVCNPYAALIAIVGRCTRYRFGGILPYPKRLGYYPALAGYFVVICLELVFPQVGSLPQSLSGLFILYGFVTVMLCILFGKRAWFRYMDFFSVYFGLVAHISPFVYRRWGVAFRKPFVGLLEPRPDGISLVLFVMFMLVSTTFDGLKETRQWIVSTLSLPGFVPKELYAIAVLAGGLLLLFGVYVLAMVVSKRLVPTRLSVRQLSLSFGMTLVPIALGYNVAHYLSYLLVNGQIGIRQISDPFDKGWNILGTAHYTVNPTPLAPHVGWYIQLLAIVGGHIVAIYLAHRVAQGLYQRRRQVIRSQVPLVSVMVLYTFIGLWVVAQPVYVATRTKRASVRKTHVASVSYDTQRAIGLYKKLH